MNRLRLAFGLIALLGSASLVIAQEASEQTAPDEIAAPTEVAAPPPTPPAAPVKPQPAELATLASKSLLLGLVNTGKHLIALGERGNIIASNDGENWAQVEVPVQSTLTGLSFADAQRGWAVGHDATIIATTDKGHHWQVQHFDAEGDKALLNVLFTDAQHGYAIGTFGLFLVTEDGGATWAELDAAPIRGENLHFNALAKLGDGNLLLVGEAGMLGISVDGKTWERLQSPYEGSFFGVIPFGAKGAIAYGLRGNVYRTDDPRTGAWTKVDLESTQSVFGASRLANGEIVLVGADSLIVVLDSAGAVKARLSKPAGALGSGTLMAVVPWKGGLLMAGELGIERRSLKP